MPGWRLILEHRTRQTRQTKLCRGEWAAIGSYARQVLAIRFAAVVRCYLRSGVFPSVLCAGVTAGKFIVLLFAVLVALTAPASVFLAAAKLLGVLTLLASIASIPAAA